MTFSLNIDFEEEKKKIPAEFSPEWAARLMTIYYFLNDGDYLTARQLYLNLPNPDGIDDWESGRSFIKRELRVLFENFEEVEIL